MFPAEYILVVIGMSVVTYLPRWLPLFALSNRRLPVWLEEWLDLIPMAILSALLLPLLITTGEPKHIVFFRPELLAAIPTFFFALKQNH